MAHRIRTRLTPMPGGGKAYWRSGSTVIVDGTQEERSDYPAVYSMCDDFVNQRDQDNPLTIVFNSRNWIPLDADLEWGGSHWKYTKCFPLAAYLPCPAPSLSSLPSVGTVATAVLARSNPNKPFVSVPNFLYELKDLPGMIRDIGRLRLQAANLRSKGVQRIHPKVAASHYLSYQMGWRPLISDLNKLLGFQAAVDKKLRELQALYNNGGIQRRIRSPQWKDTFQEDMGSITIDSGISAILNARVNRYVELERWGTVRWYPSVLPSERFDNRDLAKLARDLTFGMRGISTKQVWDAIPWSWLVSWFSNVDDFLQAHDNTVPLTHSTPCIMTKSFERRNYIREPGVDDPYTWVLGGSGANIVQVKTREMSGGSLSATIPFLNGRQFSILGALAIQRKR